jgi:hypothetical protein
MPGFQRTLLTTIAAGVTVAAFVLRPASAQAQSGYVRFDVASVADTTFTFATSGARWVSPGQVGLTVDPAHGDALIARFRIARVVAGTATAVVTSQTARLTTSHVVLLAQPKRPFYAQPWFWGGAVVGGVIGFLVHGH